jgi:uncharacterized DUF497 family protein
MRYTWNEVKRLANLKKHGLDFADCDLVFSGLTITDEDSRLDYGELRLQTFGLLNGSVVAIVHVPCGDDDRIVSMRKAERYEERKYWRVVGKFN